MSLFSALVAFSLALSTKKTRNQKLTRQRHPLLPNTKTNTRTPSEAARRRTGARSGTSPTRPGSRCGGCSSPPPFARLVVFRIFTLASSLPSFFTHSSLSPSLSASNSHPSPPSPPLRDAQRYLAHSSNREEGAASTRGPRCTRAAAAEPTFRHRRQLQLPALLPPRSSRSSRRARSSTPSTPGTSATRWRASSTSRTSWRACMTRR